MEPINKNIKEQTTAFNLHLPREVYALAKMHAHLKSETLRQWITKAILEQIGRDDTLIQK